MSIAGIGVLAALLHLAAAAHAAAPAIERPVVRLLVQNEGAPLERGVLTEVFTIASDIWRPYADVSFELSAEGAQPAQALRLIVTDRVSTLSDSASLGWIEFVDGRPARVITVSTTAAVTLMKASRWAAVPKTVQRTFLMRALGRAIAHELGHYLLASPDHAARGLMRGQLTADDVMQPSRASDRLDRGQMARLHERILLARREEAQAEIQ